MENEIPIYFAIGENDEYYGSDATKEAYDNLFRLYTDKGLSKEQIDKILVLDVKKMEYFKQQGVTNQHEGGCGIIPKR